MSNHKAYLGAGSLLSLTLLSVAILSAPKANADTSATVDLTVNVPAACSLTPANTSLTKTINPGTSDTIGTSNLKAVCNDPNGFAIYAIGYTNNTHGNTDLITDLGTDYSIHTGTGTSASNWNMTIANAEATGNYTATIENGFNEPHVVPDMNTKIATVTSTTDQTIGTNLTATFDAYIAPDQVAGTYEGKVKFTLVHPSTHQAPISRPAMLDTGMNVNAKMKSLAADSSKTYSDSDNLIKSIQTADDLPEGFEPTDANTISLADSENPVYIFFDNTDDKGIMYVYSGNATSIMNPDSSYLFSRIANLSAVPAVSFWDTSNVINMSYMFSDAGRNARVFNLDLSSWDTSNVTNINNMFYYTGESTSTFNLDLSSWDTSSVTDTSNMFNHAGSSATDWTIVGLSYWDTSRVINMESMFYHAGYKATNWSIGDLSSWDTSSVTNMRTMFSDAGGSATNWSIVGLSYWDTSSVTDMYGMFIGAGSDATTFILDLSGWNTSSVTNMGSMFSYAGRNATTWSIGNLSSWDTSNVTNMSNMFSNTGHNVTTFSLDLSSWDTSNVTYMGNMFDCAGYNATTFSLNLSSWNTSSVTNMSNMFYRSGYSATNWSITIPQINGNSISNTTSQMYGSTISTYASPASGKSFTIAQ